MADALGVLVRRAKLRAVDLVYVPARGNAPAMVLLAQQLDEGQHDRMLVLAMGHHALHGAGAVRAVWRSYGMWPDGWCSRADEDIEFALAMLGLPQRRRVNGATRIQSGELL